MQQRVYQTKNNDYSNDQNQFNEIFQENHNDNNDVFDYLSSNDETSKKIFHQLNEVYYKKQT